MMNSRIPFRAKEKHTLTNASTAELNKILVKVRSRKRQGVQLPEPVNESRARELVVRKIVLPRVKIGFGDKLKAVLLVGITQVGVRKATAQRKLSDTDILLIVKSSVTESKLEEVVKPIHELCMTLGVNPSTQVKFDTPPMDCILLRETNSPTTKHSK